MGTRVLQLSEFVAQRQRRTDAGLAFAVTADEGLEATLSFWRGASGQSYVHTVFPLIALPELPAANYILVRRRANGQLAVLKVGATVHTSPSLNLAELRHRAAQLGANEIHVHFLGGDAAHRDAIAEDLTQAHVGAADGATVH